MRRILVVDDEILVRIGIRTLLEGSDYGIVGEASGGQEALGLAARLRPDLVLTDLVMAGGGGLDLLRGLRAAEGKGPAVVILSCHNDFGLVREALREGADDYVFKLTLQKEELIEAFDRALARRPPPIAEAGTPEDHPFESFARSLLLGEPTPPAQPCPTLDRLWRLLLLEFGAAPGAAQGGGDDSAAIAQLARELARTDGSCLGVASAGSRVLMALKAGGKSEGAASFGLAEEFGARYLGRKPRGGISGPGRGLEALQALHAAAARAADEAFRRDLHPCFAEEARAEGDADGFKPEIQAARLADLRRGLEAQDADAVTAAALAALAALRAAADRDAKRLRELAAELLSPFRERAFALGFELGGLPGLASPEEAIAAARSLGEIAAIIPGFVAAFLDEARARSGLRKGIAEARRQVLAEIEKAWTVEEAAATAGMSASHFSHVWKREVGATFIDFLNGARLDRARGLLLTTDLLVREIADLVGMESLNHFGTLFRRRFGASPAELRSHSRGQGAPSAQDPAGP